MDIVRLLFDSKVTLPITVGGEIWSELFRNYNLETIRFFLDKGLSLKSTFLSKAPAGGYSTPLEEAIVLKNIDLVSFLLDRGVSATEKGAKAKTPLKLALEVGNRAIIDLLIKHGARIEDI